MREIKFRALCDWDKYGKEDESAISMLYFETLQCDNGLFCTPNPNNIHHINSYESPLMQFIGKQDKNGKDIYESDIVKILVSDNPANVCQGLIAENKVGKEVIGYIDYAPLYCQFRFTTNGITYLDLCCGAREIEVVGNIYEHQHLLL